MKLHKYIEIRIFLPGNKSSQRRRFVAPAGQAWNERGIDNHLQQITENIEKQYPTEEYRLVPLGLNRFNFVWDKPKEKDFAA